MAAAKLCALKEDNETMRELLREHGLLDQLPEKTLIRILADEDISEILQEDIEHRAEMMSDNIDAYDPLHSEFKEIMTDIRRLSKMPDALPKAMYALVELGFYYFRATDYMVRHDMVPNLDFQDDQEEVLLEAASGIVHKQCMATLAKGKDWDPSPMLTEIEHKIREYRPEEDCARNYFSQMVKIPVWYLRKCQKWRVAHAIAAKVVDGRLPAELMLMIGERVYGSWDLTVLPHTLDFWNEDGELKDTPESTPTPEDSSDSEG